MDDALASSGNFLSYLHLKEYMSRVILIMLVLGAIFRALFGMGEHVYKTTAADLQIKAAVERFQSKLPKTLDNGIVLEKLEYTDKVVRYYATEPFKNEFLDSERENLKTTLAKLYCNGQLKVFFDAKMGLEYVLTTRPRSLNDLSTETWKIALQPADCR